MECKYLVYNYKHKEGCSELIDTLWNVNGIYLSHFGGHLLELIDTLWNVNQQYPQYPQYPQPGINRYIMECK